MLLNYVSHLYYNAIKFERSFFMRKIFVVLDDALISSNDTTLRLGNDNLIVIPYPVVQRLQNFQGTIEKSKTAKEILAYLETFNLELLSQEGVAQRNGSMLRIEMNCYSSKISDSKYKFSEFELRCFGICKHLQEKNPSEKVILLTKNPLMRVDAGMLGIKAEDFKDEQFPQLKEQYSGRVKGLYCSSSAMDSFYSNKYLDPSRIYNFEEINWITNMFVIFQSEKGVQSALGRFDGEKIVSLRHQKEYPQGITPKNVGQKMLLECLLEGWETAPLTVVKGSAGTGKTFCSLAVGLEKMPETYKQILVATPVSRRKEEIGYLPGDIGNKVSPYLGGIRDNLEVIFDKSKCRKDNFQFNESGEYYFESGLIKIQPIGFLRGRTIVDTLFIIDETQNVEPSEIKSIVTRAAQGSKFIFLGDPSQIDNPNLNERYNGLVYLSEKMKGDPLCWQVTLDEGESVRSKLATIAAQKL